MPDDKKKQAMSLLFGDAPQRPAETDRAAADTEPVAKAPGRKPSVAKTASRQREESSKRPKGGTSTGKGAAAPFEAAPAAPERGGEGTPDPYYQGASRYRRASGEQVKHSVYLDPDVSQALKVAAAMGDDARGTNVSAIVNQSLRDHGYGA